MLEMLWHYLLGEPAEMLPPTPYEEYFGLDV